MDGILNLLPIYSDDANGELNVGQFLQICRTHQSFGQQDDNDHAIGIINSKLNNADSRIEGVLMLDVLVTQCRTEVFTSNCTSWIQQVIKVLQGPSRIEGGTMACNVLSKLLMFSAQFPEASRQIGTNVISQLVTLLCDEEFMHKNHISGHILKCLQSCMKHFHSACGPVKGTIERHLLSMVDWKDLSLDSKLLSTWAETLALSPGLGGSGTNGIQHKSNWIDLCTRMVHSLQLSINGLFTNIQEIKTYDVTAANALKLPELHHQNPMVLIHLERRRLTNLATALAHLLSDPFAVSKTIPMDSILEVISRLLALNSKTLSKSCRANMEQLTLGSIIPDVHSSALEILTALVSSCKGQLLTRASSVMNLHVQVLQWTLTPLNLRQAAIHRPYGKLRGDTYRSLCCWLAASRSACGLTKYADVLISQLLSDIVVHRETVQLLAVNPAGQSSGSTNKKGKKKLVEQQAGGVILHKVDPEANTQVSLAALQCLASLLLYCGPRIKPASHKEIQEIILSILMDMMKGADLKDLQPYNDPHCRAGLYRVLQKLVLCPNPHWPAPLNYATAVFNSGLNDTNLEVSTVCAEALVCIQSILRPRGPTLNLSLEMPSKPRCVQFASSPDVTAALPVASATSETPPPESSVPTEIRQPEESPSPPSMSVQVHKKNSLAQVEDCFTPPSGVTSLSSILAEESPIPQMVMTRTEAIKMIASNKAAPPPQIKPEQVTSDRKRPLPDPEPAPQQEKVLKELPYGADSVDDDLDSMLASFHDIPAE